MSLHQEADKISSGQNLSKTKDLYPAGCVLCCYIFEFFSMFFLVMLRLLMRFFNFLFEFKILLVLIDLTICFCFLLLHLRLVTNKGRLNIESDANKSACFTRIEQSGSLIWFNK